MSKQVIADIRRAEAEGAQLRRDALVRAREMVSEAQKAGEAMCEAERSKGEAMCIEAAKNAASDTAAAIEKAKGDAVFAAQEKRHEAQPHIESAIEYVVRSVIG